jgi:hypothetical protein
MFNYRSAALYNQPLHQGVRDCRQIVTSGGCRQLVGHLGERGAADLKLARLSEEIKKCVHELSCGLSLDRKVKGKAENSNAYRSVCMYPRNQIGRAFWDHGIEWLMRY